MPNCSLNNGLMDLYGFSIVCAYNICVNQCLKLLCCFPAVELLIRAHECYTKSCNMEGIATVLTMSRTLVSILSNCCQWALMVKVLLKIIIFELKS